MNCETLFWHSKKTNRIGCFSFYTHLNFKTYLETDDSMRLLNYQKADKEKAIDKTIVTCN